MRGNAARGGEDGTPDRRQTTETDSSTIMADFLVGGYSIDFTTDPSGGLWLTVRSQRPFLDHRELPPLRLVQAIIIANDATWTDHDLRMLVDKSNNEWELTHDEVCAAAEDAFHLGWISLKVALPNPSPDHCHDEENIDRWGRIGYVAADGWASFRSSLSGDAE